MSFGSWFPHGNVTSPNPPRAACSHSISVGKRPPAHLAKVCASFQLTWTTGWLSMAAKGFFEPNPWIRFSCCERAQRASPPHYRILLVAWQRKIQPLRQAAANLKPRIHTVRDLTAIWSIKPKHWFRLPYPNYQSKGLLRVQSNVPASRSCTACFQPTFQKIKIGNCKRRLLITLSF